MYYLINGNAYNIIKVVQCILDFGVNYQQGVEFNTLLQLEMKLLIYTLLFVVFVPGIFFKFSLVKHKYGVLATHALLFTIALYVLNKFAKQYPMLEGYSSNSNKKGTNAVAAAKKAKAQAQTVNTSSFGSSSSMRKASVTKNTGSSGSSMLNLRDNVNKIGNIKKDSSIHKQSITRNTGSSGSSILNLRANVNKSGNIKKDSSMPQPMSVSEKLNKESSSFTKKFREVGAYFN